MFIGHFALGLAAKRLAPQPSLATHFLAAQWADVLWPFLLLAGVEEVRIDPGNTAMTPLDFVRYPVSHSLAALAVWAALFAALYGWRRGDRRGALVLGGLVLSHWVLDVATHRPDMPLLPAGPKLGLELWRSVPATVSIELVLFAAGLAVYGRATRARDRIGSWGLGGLAALLVAAYLGAAFGPPPPNVPAIAWGAIGGAVVLVKLAAWVDAHRDPRPVSAP